MCKLKQYVLFLLHIVVASSLAVHASASGRVFIEMDSFLVSTAIRPTTLEGVVVADLYEFFAVIGADVEFYAVTGAFSVTKGEARLNMAVGSDVAYLDGRLERMPLPLTRRGDKGFWIPVRFAAECFGVAVGWRNGNTVTLNTGAGLLDALGSFGFVYDEPKQTKLTMKAALDRVMSFDTQYRNLLDSVEMLQDKRQNLNEQYDLVPQNPYLSSNDVNKALIEINRGIDAIDTQLRNVKQNTALLTASFEYVIRGYVSGIEQLRMSLFTLYQKRAIDSAEYDAAQARFELGRGTAAAVSDARIAVENDNIAAQNLESLMTGLKEELAVLLRYKRTDNVTVTLDSPEFDADVDAFVYKQLATAPTIVMAQREVDTAKYALTTHYALDPNDATSERRLEVEYKVTLAERALADAKRSLENNIRAQYRKIDQIEIEYKKLTLDVENAKRIYEQAATALYAGVGLQSAADMARLGLLNAEIAVKQNRINYANAAFMLINPFLIQ